MKIAIGSDHAGYELKEGLKKYFNKANISYIDVGTDNAATSVDYPDYGKKVAMEVISKHLDFGIAICGTGIGISIAANKVKGIRAALIYDMLTAKLAKEHNNANVIAFGGRVTSLEEAIKMLDVYMNTKFDERHQSRIDKIGKE